MATQALDADKKFVLRTDYASCEIGLCGGHILSWKLMGEEQLFMSSKAVMDGGESGTVAVRGGVPICWPQFGFFETAANAPKVKHGLVRCSNNWVATEVSSRSAVLTLVPDKAMKARWPMDFEFRYKVNIQVTLPYTNSHANSHANPHTTP